jgi:hypothetical protein
MRNFARDYAGSFAEFGSALAPRDGCAESLIVAAEERLGIRAPRSLRDYYLVAGEEGRFNQIHNRLLPPEKWFVDRGHLAFMEENQVVVYWGVEASPSPADDPPVFQGVRVRAEPIAWYREHDRCSVFLTVLLHWHGAFGGAMGYTGTAPVPADIVGQLDRDWVFAGEVNKMRAYHRNGQVVCFVEWRDPIDRMRKCSPWRIFVGASTGEGLQEIAKDLDIALEDSGT